MRSSFKSLKIRNTGYPSLQVIRGRIRDFHSNYVANLNNLNLQVALSSKNNFIDLRLRSFGTNKRFFARRKTAEVICVGTEIVEGEIVDTNSGFISRNLRDFGIDLLHTHHVRDNKLYISSTIEKALRRSSLVFVVGGLGPTMDDLTKESVAKVFKEEEFIDPELENQLRNFFSMRYRKMPESNVKQASIIKSAIPIANRVGTAPGWFIETKQFSSEFENPKAVFVLPGPPSELQVMFRDQVKKLLRAHKYNLNLPSTLRRSVIIKLSGIGESLVQEKLNDLFEKYRNLSISSFSEPSKNVDNEYEIDFGIYHKQNGIVEVKMTLYIVFLPFVVTNTDKNLNSEIGNTLSNTNDENNETILEVKAKIAAQIEEFKTEVLSRLEKHVWGYDEDKFEDYIGRGLIKKNIKLAVMEFMTGGCLMNTLSNAKEASAFFAGGMVSPKTSKLLENITNVERTSECNTLLSVYSEEAKNIRNQFKVELGICIGDLRPLKNENEEINEYNKNSIKSMDQVHIVISFEGGIMHSLVKFQSEWDKDRKKLHVVTNALTQLKRYIDMS